jgi:LuxR family maltose regulon positive regulatory protein
MPEPTDLKTAAPVLGTKIHRPSVSPILIARGRLLDQLAGWLDGRLILVSAPAGYGKTALASQWLAKTGGAYAWLTLDGQDNDLSTYLKYLVASIRTVCQDAMAASDLLLRAPALPDPRQLADVLLHDMAALPDRFILVLDDYHVLRAPGIHELMARLVEHLPAHLHLVLITRADPPLPLDRLRGRGQLGEIRAADLRFSAEEALLLLRQALGPDVSEETAALLEDSTEGWAVGLQLAALSLRSRSDRAAYARKIAQHGHQAISEYLLSEVLGQLPAAQRDGLLQTSLCDRFCAPLIDAVQAGDGTRLPGDDFVRTLQRCNLFVVALDDQGVWFRYHHFFQSLLRARLSQRYADGQITAMHARASAWFASQGLLDEAIVHAVQAGDTQRAATLVEDHAYAALDREDWRQAERWIGLLPAELLSRPRLLAVQGWLNFIRFRLAGLGGLVQAIEAAIARAEAAGEALPATLPGEVAVMRCIMAWNTNDGAEMLRWSTLAIPLLRPEMQYVRGLASFFHLIGLQAVGRRQEAVALAYQQLGLYEQYPALALRILLGLTNLHYEMADAAAMQSPATAFELMAQQTGMGLSMAWADYALGWLHYQRNELAAAEQRFQALVATAHGRALVDGSTGLALARLVQGHPAEALAVAADLRDRLLARGLLALVPLADSLRQRVLLQCDPAAALAGNYRIPETPFPIEYWEQPTLTRVRTLLAGGAPEDLAQAQELLAQRRTLATACHARRSLIEIQALHAQVLAAQGRQDAALAALRQAVELAAPGGALRLLADCGPQLAGLLETLARDGVAPAYVRRVLAALGAAPAAAASQPARQPAAGQTPSIDDMIETLTNRELDVLLLLAARLTDKEIAGRLVLSPMTVKKHTQRIYRKLGVNSRRAAVAQARRLGLI